MKLLVILFLIKFKLYAPKNIYKQNCLFFYFLYFRDFREVSKDIYLRIHGFCDHHILRTFINVAKPYVI